MIMQLGIWMHVSSFLILLLVLWSLFFLSLGHKISGLLLVLAVRVSWWVCIIWSPFQEGILSSLCHQLLPFPSRTHSGPSQCFLMYFYSFFFRHWLAAPCNFWICYAYCLALLLDTSSSFSLLPLKPDFSSSGLATFL